MSFRAATSEHLGAWIHRAASVVRRRTAAPGAAGRVAVLCESFVRYGTAQAIGLRAAGANVTFYYVDRLNEFGGNRTERDQFIETVVRAGIPVVKLPPRQLRRMRSQISWLHRDLTQRQIEAVIVHAHIDPRYATLGLRFRVALVVHDPAPHSGDYESAFPIYVRALSRFSELTAAAVLFHSERLLPQRLPILRAIPWGIIPHGADMARAAAPITRPPTLLIVGRLMAYKGVDVALDALRLVRASRPDIKLILAGRGDLGDAIRARRQDGVELQDGYISDTQLEELLAAARLVLLPYRDATQSGVGLLAAARGIPCIVSDVGALSELVPPGSEARVVPVGSSAALAKAVLESVDHSASDRDHAHQYAAQTFAWPVAGTRLLSELSRLKVTSGNH